MTHLKQSPINWHELLAHPQVERLIALALEEDIGTGDITTQAIFSGPQQVTGHIVARRPTVACGVTLAQKIFTRFDPDMNFKGVVEEGTPLQKSDLLLRFAGDIRAVLTAERCALNFLMRLCGVAYAAQQAQAAIPADCHARVLDTRKTTPGMRLLEKAAVATGGADNHRIGLFDAILIKDNHIAAAGSVTAAVEKARAYAPASMTLEVEVDTLAQLEEALRAGAHLILLDNFSLPDMAEAVRRTAGRALLEASGGITAGSLAAIARTGVDRISMGALTHSVQPADLSLEVDQ